MRHWLSKDLKYIYIYVYLNSKGFPLMKSTTNLGGVSSSLLEVSMEQGKDRSRLQSSPDSIETFKPQPLNCTIARS